MALGDLRRSVMKEGHSDYAFKQGFKQLLNSEKLQEYHDKEKQGNHNMVRWVSPRE